MVIPRYHFQAPIALVYKRNTTRVEAQRCSWSHTLSSSSAQSETGFRFDLSLYHRRRLFSERRLQNSYSSSSFHHEVKVRREYDEERLFSSPLRSAADVTSARTLSTRRHSLSQTNTHTNKHTKIELSTTQVFLRFRKLRKKMLIGYAVSWAPIPIMPLSPSDPPFFGDGERRGRLGRRQKGTFFRGEPLEN